MYRNVTAQALVQQGMKQFNAFVAAAPEVELGDGPLSGLRLAVKDVFVDHHRAPTCGSNVHPGWMRGTATVLERLRGAGAEIVGYANLHEWGVGTSGLVSALGPMRNPWDPTRIAGGSSGGSAAAVAAGMVDAAIGTDAGGSIRIPSACCGIVGLKPTHGSVPTDGFFADGSGVDHIGPMTRDVATARTIFEVLCDRKMPPVEVAKLRVGVAREFFFADLDPALATALAGAIALVGSLGAETRDVVVANAQRSRKAMPALVLAGLLDRLAPRFAERIDDFQPETRDMFLRARSIDEAARAEARRIQESVKQGFADAFRAVDVVVTPTLSAPPVPIDDPVVRLPSGERSIDQAYVPLNAPMNHAGVPSLTLPCAELDDGTTVGLTLTADRGAEAVVLALGEALESALGGRYADRVAPGDRRDG